MLDSSVTKSLILELLNNNPSYDTTDWIHTHDDEECVAYALLSKTIKAALPNLSTDSIHDMLVIIFNYLSKADPCALAIVAGTLAEITLSTRVPE